MHGFWNPEHYSRVQSCFVLTQLIEAKLKSLLLHVPPITNYYNLA
jgi:hypothetical protein